MPRWDPLKDIQRETFARPDLKIYEISKSFPLRLVFSSFFLSNPGKQGSFAPRILCFWSGHIQLHPHSCYTDRCWTLLTAAKLRRFEPAHARIDGYHVWSCISDYKWWSFTNLGNPENKEKAPPALTKIWPFAQNSGNIFMKPRLVCRPFCSSPVWIWGWISHSFPLFPIQFWSLSMFNWWRVNSQLPNKISESL